MGREARDAEPGRRKNNQAKKKRKNNQAKKKRKNQKKKKSMKSKNNANKNKTDRRKRRKGSKKGKNKRPNKKTSKRKGPGSRQSTDCLADVVTAIKGYRSAGNQKRMAMRIVAWKKNMAATQFEDAAASLDSATGGGKTCGSGAPDTDTTDALTKLKNCSKSAAALCDDSTVNDTGADGCKTKFEAYITAFDDCVKTPTCDCFKALTPVESSCSFKDANDAAKALKDKCFKSDTPGSFGDCSKSLKEAAGKIGKCGLGVGTGPVGTTTKSARNLRRLAFAKF